MDSKKTKNVNRLFVLLTDRNFENLGTKHFSHSKNIGEDRFCLNRPEKKLFKFESATFSWDAL